MTTARQAPARLTRSAPPEDPEPGARRSPVIVLGYAFSGAAKLGQMLSGTPDLACTSGTGVLPMCHQAAATWQQVDGRDGPMSSLARASVRTLAGTMIGAILARTGGTRWCEISIASPATAGTFLQLYPETTFLLVHRSCPDVIRDCVRANPWGVAGTSMAEFAAVFPGSSAAAVAAYWAECTDQLLRFESAHPAACHRIRYENLTGTMDQPTQEILALLGLTPAGRTGLARGPQHAAAADDTPGRTETPIPAAHLPGPLVQRVNELQAHLGYPPVA